MKRTKDLLMALVSMLMPLSVMAANATLSIESFDIKAGETKDLLIDLSNPSDEITLVQFDLRLPDGLSVAMDGSEYAIDIAGRTTYKKHSLDANATNNVVRFLLSSTKNTVLEGTSGAIISISLSANSYFNGGTIRLENILLVTPDEKEIKPADVEYAISNETPTPSGDWHDGDEFTAKTIEGIDMKFKVISAEKKTCQVGFLTYTDEIGDDSWSSIDCATEGTVTIPATVNGLAVVKVGNDAFISCDKLKSVIIPEGVIEVGCDAFSELCQFSSPCSRYLVNFPYSLHLGHANGEEYPKFFKFVYLTFSFISFDCDGNSTPNFFLHEVFRFSIVDESRLQCV